MTSALIFALSMAGFGLLVFGERMGLGTERAAWGVAVIFALAAVSLALASTTSRLNRFMVGTDRGAALAAIVASVLLFGWQIETSQRPEVSGSALALLLGFLVALVFAPFNPWRNFGARAARRNATVRIDQDPAQGTAGALPVVSGVAAVAAGLIAICSFPVVIDTLIGVTGWPRGASFLAALALIGAPAVLGGLLGTGRMALVLMAIALVTLVVPFVGVLLGEFFARFNGATIGQFLASGPEAARALAAGVTLQAEWPALALGFLSGLVVLQPAAAPGAASTRGFAVLAGLAMALVLALVVRADERMLREIIASRIVAVPPAQWPVFVFDDTLRGWLSTCGIAPEDAQAAGRACGTGHPRNILPPEAYRFADGLAAPALALAQGWPIILGFISGLVKPLIALVALGVMLHAAAAGIAERLLFRTLHPRALRAWRLAMARLLLIALLILVYVLEEQGLRLDSGVFRWLLLGLGLTGLAAMIGYRLLLLIRFFRARRVSRATVLEAPSPETVPEPTPEPA